MDTLSTLVQHVPKVLYLCHLAQPSWDIHDRTRLVSIRREPSWCFGAWQFTLRNSNAKRVVPAVPLHDRYLWPTKCTSLSFSFTRRTLTNVLLVGSIKHKAGRDFNLATRRRHPFGMCTLWHRVKHPCNLADNGTNRVFSWLVFKIVDIIQHHAVQHNAVIVAGVITNILVAISVLSAFPWVRKSVFQFYSWICW